MGARDHRWLWMGDDYCAHGWVSIRQTPASVHCLKGKTLVFIVDKGRPYYALHTQSVRVDGWKKNFISWFSKVFIPSVQALLDTSPVVLLFDGHHSHITKSSNIHLVCLPAHTSHILQPMDVRVFGPMKAAWKRLLKEYKTILEQPVLLRTSFHHFLISCGPLPPTRAHYSRISSKWPLSTQCCSHSSI